MSVRVPMKTQAWLRSVPTNRASCMQRMVASTEGRNSKTCSMHVAATPEPRKLSGCDPGPKKTPPAAPRQRPRPEKRRKQQQELMHRKVSTDANGPPLGNVMAWASSNLFIGSKNTFDVPRVGHASSPRGGRRRLRNVRSQGVPMVPARHPIPRCTDGACGTSNPRVCR